MATIHVTIPMDTELLREAEALFQELGLDMNTACSMFLSATVREQRIPFAITED